MILRSRPVVWPIFAIAGLGWAWRRLGRPFDQKAISAIVTYLGVPSLLLSSLSKTSIQLDVLLQTLLAGDADLPVALVAAGGPAADPVGRRIGDARDVRESAVLTGDAAGSIFD
jgi:predicted permease